MAFTEIQRRGGKKYYYRVRSVRKGGKVGKERIFLGAELGTKERSKRERRADRELGLLTALLTKNDLAFLDGVKADLAKEPQATFDNRYEAFVAQFTYDSNAIEGNTLTLDETSQLLFEGLVPARSLREVREALNHKQAFDHVLAYRANLTKKFICSLHELVVKDTLAGNLVDQIGRYRTVQVYIRGVDWVPPKPTEVPKDMKALLEWHTKNRRKVHPVVAAAYFHTGFELIHPFVDGNGRVGRLLMSFMLRRNGFPMVNVPNARKREYYAALYQGQVKGDLRPFLVFIMDEYRRSRLRF